MKKGQKYPVTREVERRPAIRWSYGGKKLWKAKEDDYVLTAQLISLDSYQCFVYKEGVCVFDGRQQPDTTTLEQAKNRAVYQMGKHKRETIRKTINNA